MSNKNLTLQRALETSKWGYLEISHGTLRSYDLFHAFRDALKVYAPRGYITKHKLGFFSIPKAAKYDDTHDFWYCNAVQDVLDSLMDALIDISPEGFYFGGHEGDGSSFGWWKVEKLEIPDMVGYLNQPWEK